ncbi:MAG TPA: LysM peptidoglycan-binding domain-containing protein [Schlesneria sp.]
MHQDQRIGLALAVLLLGAAGAFFFRHDPKPTGSTAHLKTGAELDARIAEKSISPYLQSTDRGTSTRNVSDRQETDDGSLPRLDTPDFFTEGERASNSDVGLQELAPIPFPDTNDGNSASSQGAGTAKSSLGSDRTHIVQKGETLSSIAAKELGSSGRFQELFEANRDQLKDANDVRVGMILRVPTRGTRAADSAVSKPKGRDNGAPSLLPGNPNRPDVSELPVITVDPDQQPASRSSDPNATKKLFEPAKRHPLGVKTPGTQSSQVEPAKPARKLSQLPPKDAGGKVAR